MISYEEFEDIVVNILKRDISSNHDQKKTNRRTPSLKQKVKNRTQKCQHNKLKNKPKVQVVLIENNSIYNTVQIKQKAFRINKR